jgi:hypothetical protein
LQIRCSKNLLRVALAVCDAHCTPAQIRFSTTIAAARNGLSSTFEYAKAKTTEPRDGSPRDALWLTGTARRLV